MNSIKRILEGNFELNDSMKNYEEVSYTRPEVKTDEKGTYKEKVSYLSYKGISEYPDNGIIGEKVEKIYEKSEHKEVCINKETLDLEFMIDNLLENQPLYKDSGLWQIRTDDMVDVIFQQGVNESFFEFIQRVYNKENSFIGSIDD